MSLKKLQSEIGVTGDTSPNIPLMEQICLLAKSFNHVHNTVTNNDCLLILSNTLLGKTIDQSEHGMQTHCAMIGCDNDLLVLFISFFQKNPAVIELVMAAACLASSGHVQGLRNPNQEEDGDGE